ncbi:RagB/SusD family nutrient uptake outer membrane protein [Hymenobacter sp. NBH84]|uniref:RagB/SusD family nutrient uptake outer membrane protein n=1 Tax=Hymenobacter sp. NBH84 TaxID=2596915 RepID=UPI00162A4B68|nr:RagB/SusD family nutrient uptake outer membrane protein [Hymenobacter sp. NBH84]QNE40383.1 RagB/SusD family nutrient uptake outer membrane protein [Hymenobacter sp. NBH84]
MNHNLFSLFTLHKSRLLALSALLTVGLGACEVTDLEPKDSISESAAFSDAGRVNLAVVGVYNAAQSGFYDPLNGSGLAVRGYPFGAAANELDDIRGEDVVDMAGFFGIVYANNITPSTPNNVNMWSTLYALINQTNVTIEGVNNAAVQGIIPTADATVYEGEMRFLRALAYHELLIHFCRPYTDNRGNNPGVPYRDFAINTPAAVERARTLDRGTVASVYTSILADLDIAESNLPATRTGNARVSRATKGAAVALKQRLRLHQGEWEAATTEGAKLISGTTTFTSPIGSYALTATPQGAFPGGTAVTTESIFSIENSSDDNPGVNGALPNFFGSPNTLTANPAGIGARGLIAISPVLFNAPFWSCSDLRRTQLLQATSARYYSYKYKDAANNTDWAPIIRYAEVLLNQAEAQARRGNAVQALALLNAVRNRAVTTATEQYTASSFTSSDDLVRAILNERRVEFVAEGFRWDDIHRLSPTPFSPVPGGGIPSKAQSAQAVIANYNCNTRPSVSRLVDAIPYTDYRFLWPIPAIEVANNPTLAAQQNPGY